MRIMSCALLLVLAGSLVAQEKSKWRRVYTYEDAVIDMEEIKLSFGNFGRVRFRTVYHKPENVPGKPGVKYKTLIEDMELKCKEREYRVIETTFLDSKGTLIQSSNSDGLEDWKRVKNDMMERLFTPACRMITKKKL